MSAGYVRNILGCRGQASCVRLRGAWDALFSLQRSGGWRSTAYGDGFEIEDDKDGWLQ
jgi:hypothetical protein